MVVDDDDFQRRNGIKKKKSSANRLTDTHCSTPQRRREKYRNALELVFPVYYYYLLLSNGDEQWQVYLNSCHMGDEARKPISIFVYI